MVREKNLWVSMGKKMLIGIEQFSVLIFWAHLLECTQYLLRTISIADLFCFFITGSMGGKSLIRNLAICVHILGLYAFLYVIYFINKLCTGCSIFIPLP